MKVREDRGSCWPRPFFKKADVNEEIDAERTRGLLLSYLHALSLKFCVLVCVCVCMSGHTVWVQPVSPCFLFCFVLFFSAAFVSFICICQPITMQA